MENVEHVTRIPTQKKIKNYNKWQNPILYWSKIRKSPLVKLYFLHLMPIPICFVNQFDLTPKVHRVKGKPSEAMQKQYMLQAEKKSFDAA